MNKKRRKCLEKAIDYLDTAFSIINQIYKEERVVSNALVIKTLENVHLDIEDAIYCIESAID